MKKILQLLLVCATLSLVGTTASSCSKKTGCPYNDYTNKDKKPGKKRGKSNLFPKKMRKKN